MDIRAYIESGILEQYALGMLDREQSAEVEANVNKYPELREELQKIERALEQFASGYAMTPPPSARAAVLDQVARDLETESRNREVSPGKTAAGSWRTLLIAASWILLVGLLVWHFSEKRSASQQNTALQTQLDSIEQQLNTLTTDCDELERRYQSMITPGTTPIYLAGTPLSPASNAVVFYNAQTRSSFLASLQLPDAPQGKQYQLWAIVGDTPVDMGVIPLEADSDAWIDIPFIENAAAFAVTLENAGGSPTPTLDQMYIIGSPG